MKKKPLISVIISYYKKKKFIKKTLDSISNQTYKNFEVIFVYDDEDLVDVKFIKKLLLRFKKKKIIINKKNLGVANSRNLAIKYSKGTYLAFIDADDIWKKNKLSKQLYFMEKNSYHFSFTSYAVIDEKDKILKKRRVNIDADYSNLYNSNFIGLNTVMINKKIISSIHFPNLSTQEDFALWLKLARKGIKLKHLNQTLSFWRKSKNSLSSNILYKLRDAFKLYYIYEKKNFIFSVYSVIVLSYNKLIRTFN
tara:strand:- start:473 stop:1228 length:756 start_codon:yes stop_codon:yes gene_type:complete